MSAGGEEQSSDQSLISVRTPAGLLRPGDWWTEEQIAFINAQAVNAAYENVLRPSIDDLAKSFEQIGQALDGLFQITAKVEKAKSQQAPPVFDPNDMKRVVFIYHPSEPIKVSETRGDPIHCLVVDPLQMPRHREGEII